MSRVFLVEEIFTGPESARYGHHVGRDTAEAHRDRPVLDGIRR